MRYPRLEEDLPRRSVITEFRGLNCTERIEENEFCAMENMSSDKYPLLSTRMKKREKYSEDYYHTVAMASKDDYVVQLQKDNPFIKEDVVVINGHGAVGIGDAAESIKGIVFSGNFVYLFLDNPIRVGLTGSNAGHRKEPLEVAKNFFGSLSTCNLFPSNEHDPLGEYYEAAGKPGDSSEEFSEGSKWRDINGKGRYVLRSGKWVEEDFPVYFTASISGETKVLSGDYMREYDKENHRYVLKKCKGESWETVPHSKIKLTWSEEIGFSKGDGLLVKRLNDKNEVRTDTGTISVLVYKAQENEEKDGVTNTGETVSVFKDGYIQIDDCSDFLDIPVPPDGIGQHITVSGFQLAREVPQMDFVCEHNNRLWGCSREKNEVYASKLGDPRNWNVFSGLSTDSYAMTLGSGGKVTAICSFRDAVYLFKENAIHKIVGTKPANFQIYTIQQNGVALGAENSIIEVDGILYYYALDGVCAFDGQNRKVVSKPIENLLRKRESVDEKIHVDAATANLKYYLWVPTKTNTSENQTLFVYDTKTGLWHAGESFKGGITSAASYKNTVLYYDGKNLCSTNAEEALPQLLPTLESNEIESYFRWYAETGPVACDVLEKKYVQKLQFRFLLSDKFWSGKNVLPEFSLAVNYDESGWEEVYTCTDPGEHTAVVTLMPRRSDRIRFKFYGTGECKIYTFVRDLEFGSDVR